MVKMGPLVQEALPLPPCWFLASGKITVLPHYCRSDQYLSLCTTPEIPGMSSDERE